MNIVGKILVILNLVFALIVGGFMIFHSATGANYREKYVALEREMQVAQKSYENSGVTLGKYDLQNKKIEQERDTARQELADAQTLLKAQEASAKAKLDEAELRAKDADLTAQRILAEKERYAKQELAMLQIIKQRDDTIVAQQADIVKFRNAAVAQESAFRAAQDRLEQQLTRNAELEKTIAKMSTGGASGDGAIVKGLSNPPTVYVAGKIELIHKEDATLVQVSVGSDKGLTKNHTLEVYRLDPPLYLGMLRIVDVQPHQAVGRLERVGTGNRTPLRVGDNVASTLTRK